MATRATNAPRGAQRSSKERGTKVDFSSTVMREDAAMKAKVPMDTKGTISRGPNRAGMEGFRAPNSSGLA